MYNSKGFVSLNKRMAVKLNCVEGFEYHRCHREREPINRGPQKHPSKLKAAFPLSARSRAKTLRKITVAPFLIANIPLTRCKQCRPREPFHSVANVRLWWRNATTHFGIHHRAVMSHGVYPVKWIQSTRWQRNRQTDGQTERDRSKRTRTTI